MLHEFLSFHRTELIDRCQVKVMARRTPKTSDKALRHGIPLFLDQLIETLREERSSNRPRGQIVSGSPDGGGAPSSHIEVAAAKHGLELLQQGFTVDQVVHDYGDLCQAITQMALENKAPVAVGEFQTMNRCLDNAIAGAVSEYSYEREVLLSEKGVQSLNERLGFLAHELRNMIHVGTLAFSAIKTGRVAVTGATGAVVDRSLIGLRNLIDRTLADVRLTMGAPPDIVSISITDFIAQVKAAASLEAQARECKFTVAVEPCLVVDGDRDLLHSAVGNLLQNAFKYTKLHTEVSLNVSGSGDRILIEVEDQCGGLPQGFVDTMFLPFVQGSADRSGLGLGLAICRRIVEASNGFLSVRNKPGHGCIFTIDMPRHAITSAAPSDRTI